MILYISITNFSSFPSTYFKIALIKPLKKKKRLKKNKQKKKKKNLLYN
jgi:hypothetical protein